MRMIVQLRGTVAEATLSTVVLDVSGVGFELGISGTTAAALPPVGAEAMLYVRMQVREDAMTLFGFATREERSLFGGGDLRRALKILRKILANSAYARHTV